MQYTKPSVERAQTIGQLGAAPSLCECWIGSPDNCITCVPEQ